jgi:hypothetical protein
MWQADTSWTTSMEATFPTSQVPHMSRGSSGMVDGRAGAFKAASLFDRPLCPRVPHSGSLPCWFAHCGSTEAHLKPPDRTAPNLQEARSALATAMLTGLAALRQRYTLPT